MILNYTNNWKSTDKLVWLGWVATMSIGWVLFLGIHITMSLGNIGPPEYARVDTSSLQREIIEKSLFFIVLSGVTSAVQWLLLQIYFPNQTRTGLLWVFGSTISWTIFLVLISQSPVFYPSIVFGISGGLIGVIQWLALRPVFPRANWWLLIHLGTLAIIAIAVILVNSLILLAGTLYGAFTGYAFISLFRTMNSPAHVSSVENQDS